MWLITKGTDMKRTIRIGVWETNSSSTHSLTVCDYEDYEAWKNGNLLYHWGDLVTEAEAMDQIKNNEWYQKHLDFTDAEAVRETLEEDYWTYEQYERSIGDMDEFKQTFTTKSGDKVIAFGYAGFDG